jgi:hypothetical protein
LSYFIDGFGMSGSAEASPHSDFCPLCHINLAQKFCSECGQVFCLQCARQETTQFYTCSVCGPGSIEETEKGHVCKECGEPASLATRRDKLCPNCGSSIVTPIHNMRQALVSRFRTTYYRLRVGHELLSGFAARLRMLRWRVRELRMGRFMHDPEVEKQLLNLMTTELSSVNERILFRARGVVERHRASKNRFMYPEQWTSSDFPLLAGLIEGIHQDVTDYENYVQELVNELDAKLATIDERITRIEGWHKLFREDAEVLCLADDERPVAVVKPVALDRTATSEGVDRGILFVTTQRLLFVGKKGILSRELRLVHAAPLKAVAGLVTEGRLRKHLLIQLQDQVLKVHGPSRILQEVPDALSLATSFPQQSLVTTSGSMRVLNLKVDMTAFRNELDNLINFAIGSDETLRERGYDPDRRLVHPDFYPQSDRLAGGPAPDRMEANPLFQLQQQRYSLQSTMQLLKHQFEEGKINDESFFKQYRSLTRELYLVESRIRKLAGDAPPEKEPHSY